MARGSDRYEFHLVIDSVVGLPVRAEGLEMLVSWHTGKKFTKTQPQTVHGGLISFTSKLRLPVVMRRGEDEQLYAPYKTKVILKLAENKKPIGIGSLDLSRYARSGRAVPVSLPLDRSLHPPQLKLLVSCKPLAAKQRKQGSGSGSARRERTTLERQTGALRSSSASSASLSSPPPLADASATEGEDTTDLEPATDITMTDEEEPSCDVGDNIHGLINDMQQNIDDLRSDLVSDEHRGEVLRRQSDAVEGVATSSNSGGSGGSGEPSNSKVMIAQQEIIGSLRNEVSLLSTKLKDANDELRRRDQLGHTVLELREKIMKLDGDVQQRLRNLKLVDGLLAKKKEQQEKLTGNIQLLERRAASGDGEEPTASASGASALASAVLRERVLASAAASAAAAATTDALSEDISYLEQELIKTKIDYANSVSDNEVLKQEIKRLQRASAAASPRRPLARADPSV